MTLSAELLKTLPKGAVLKHEDDDTLLSVAVLTPDDHSDDIPWLVTYSDGDFTWWSHEQVAASNFALEGPMTIADHLDAIRALMKTEPYMVEVVQKGEPYAHINDLDIFAYPNGSDMTRLGAKANGSNYPLRPRVVNPEAEEKAALKAALESGLTDELVNAIHAAGIRAPKEEN